MKQHNKKKNYKNFILSFILILFIITLLVSSIFIIKWYIDCRENEKIEEQISQVVVIENNEKNEEEKEYKIDFDKLKDINEETVAWLKVNNTNIKYAVVKSKNNSYYLNHNFEKKYNSGGWIFVDYHNKLDGTDKNIVIYGHNMKDNSMFGTLKNILKEEWYGNEENYIIDFITEEKHYQYQVFSIYKIEKEDYYINTEFKKNEFEEFIYTLKDRSIKDFNIDVSAEDSILTLSTCADNNKYRLVLHAKKI